MSDDAAAIQRRTVLQMAVGLAASGALPGALPGPLPAPRARRDATPPKPTGKPGDFDFLAGEWTIENRQRKGDEWDEFDGEATVHRLLDGLVSVEELRIPERKFSGMGLRILERSKRLWADYWMNSRDGVLAAAPAWGSFVDGVGLWDGDDVEEGKPIIVRGAWDEITKRSCRWYQAVSRDDGKTWDQSWIMEWTRRK
ncbi:MAG: hypothetical protein JNL90_19950 [Planctomycetes bacterium]|nr:hypothetical protein [Planctomycetota bacterium]